MIPERWLPVVLAALAFIPVGALVAVVLARRRIAHGMPTRTAWQWSVAEVGLVLGTAPWVWMILTPLAHTRELHAVPLLDLLVVLRGGPTFAVVQIGGNLLVFAALGLFAPLRWRIGPLAVTLIAAVGSLTLETLQYVLAIGRVSATDDVLLNAAGAGLVALLARPLTRRLWSMVPAS